MPNRDEFGTFAIGILVGGLTATVVALLFAPQSGEETRALIKEKSIELRDQAQQTAEEAMARAEAIAKEARTRGDELTRQILKGQRQVADGSRDAGGQTHCCLSLHHQEKGLAAAKPFFIWIL